VSSWLGFPWRRQNSHAASKGARQEAWTRVSVTGTDHSAGCARSLGRLVHLLYPIKRAPIVQNANTQKT